MADAALKALGEIIEKTKNLDIIFAVGLPIKHKGKLYNTAAVSYKGRLLGLIPKIHLPNYNEFYEKRVFCSADRLGADEYICFNGEKVDFSANLLFYNDLMEEFSFGVEICEDLWVPCPPSVKLCQAGANIILNPSASNDIAGKADYRRDLVKMQSARLICGYVYADCGDGESTTDMVFSAHSMIYENGCMLNERKPFSLENNILISDIDVSGIEYERRRTDTFTYRDSGIKRISFSMNISENRLRRVFPRYPFVPSSSEDIQNRCLYILSIQSHGLKKRLEQIKSDKAVIGISGGLDSTLALIVTVRAFRLMNKPAKDILCISMPCFGTTERTEKNAEKLCSLYNVTYKKIDIKESVSLHMRDIGHSGEYDTTYENCQARERTQILMDTANMENGIVIGTGDLSESALGWSTYNGDHMSGYNVNASVPKTLVRYLVKYEADFCSEANLKETLYDILSTPVSPELLPSDGSEIIQKTEDILGPYELHDFFLYYFIRKGFSPSKIYRICRTAFKEYSDKFILDCLKLFIKRFFMQQYKRSCMPDSPKVGSVSLSPRGDLRMPSDAEARLWTDDLENIKQ